MIFKQIIERYRLPDFESPEHLEEFRDWENDDKTIDTIIRKALTEYYQNNNYEAFNVCPIRCDLQGLPS